MKKESKLNLNAGDYAISHCDSDKTYNGLEVHKMLCDAYIAGNNDTLDDEDEKIRHYLMNFVKLNDGVNLPPDDAKKALAWLEKQGTPAKLSEEEQNRFAKGVLTSCALSFIDYLDAHEYEGKMCVSNGECEDIENAFHNAMWDKLHRYYCKYIEKQGEQKPEENKGNIGGISTDEEAVLDALIRRLKGEDIHVSPHLAVECLESLKSRVKQKQEWSEEDEQHIDSLLKRLDALCRNKFERTRFAISEDRDWLKSLRPLKRWKPSDEQVSLLQAIINEPNNAASESCQIVLKDILEQLKKLKEE